MGAVSLTSPNGDARPASPSVRIAAAGDMHCQPSRAEEAREAFSRLAGEIDLLLLAGDLTTHGQPEQARVLADACRDLEVPIFAVWGNHDWHSNQVDELRPILEDAGITILDRETATVCVGPTEIGIVGLKAIAHCPVRIVLMHYAPSLETLVGEPESIWTMLGNDRIAAPIIQHEPDMVLHGHAHVGTFEGRIGDVPVYNVSVPVLGKDFWIFELTGLERATAPLH